MTKRYKIGLWSSAAVALASGGATCSAQTAPMSRESASGDDIIVTAQRRSERLERTPVAISVLPARQIAERAIVSDADLQFAVPGVTVRATQASNQLTFSIRGQTVDAYTNSKAAVPIYVNEVQVSSNSNALTLFDLSSIQVLKGPQGTLFGRNATGGAVLFTTAPPSQNFGGYAMARVGNYDMQSLEGALNLPIVTDRLALRLAGYYQHRDGFQKDDFSSSRIGTVRRHTLRASVLATPVDGLENSTVFEYNKSGGSNTSPVLYSIYPVGSNAAPVPANFLYSPAVDAILGPGGWDAFLAAHPKADPAGIIAYGAKQKQRGPYRISLNEFPSHRAYSYLVSNITSLDITDSLKFRNIAGFSSSFARDGIDYDGSPFPVEGGFIKTRVRQYANESQLVGSTNLLDYVLGVYYSSERVHFTSFATFVDLSPRLPAASAAYNAISRDTSLAGYAQGTFKLGDLIGVPGLAVIAGFRYTREKVSAEQLPGAAFYNFPAPGASNYLSNVVRKPSWQLGIQEQLSSDLLLYAVSRHSFRSGGLNTTAPPFPRSAAQGGAEFSPETATDIEIGAKFRGIVSGIPVRANIAVYNGWIRNIQRSVYASIPEIGGALAGLTANIPRAEVSGVEFDTSVIPADGWELSAGLTYTRARFTNNTAELFGTVTRFGPYADTPRWSGTASVSKSFALPGDVGELALRADVYAQTKTFFSSLNDTIVPGTKLPGYALVNIRASINHVMGSHLSVAGYVRNVFDRTYYVGGLPVGSLQTLNTAIPGEPRTFMVEAKFEF